MGNLYKNAQNTSKALELYNLVLDICSNKKGENCFEAMKTLNNMGNLYENQNPSKALELFEKVLKICETKKGLQSI